MNSWDEKTFGPVRFIPVSQGPETVTGGEKLKLVKTELKGRVRVDFICCQQQRRLHCSGSESCQHAANSVHIWEKKNHTEY